MTHNFGGRKFWGNSSHQKMLDNILVNSQVPKIIIDFYRSNGIIEYFGGAWLE